MPTLILLRHGQSEWNEKNLFTGWVDVRLTPKGAAEATRGGELIAEAGLKPDILYTSVLTRAIQTANLALEAADRAWLPVKRSWRLNERHYGALQGKDKAQTLAEFGEEQFMTWRRSFDTRRRSRTAPSGASSATSATPTSRTRSSRAPRASSS